MHSKICPYCWESDQKEYPLTQKKVDYLPCTGITFLGKYLGKKGSCGDTESDCCSVWECNRCGEAFRG